MSVVALKDELVGAMATDIARRGLSDLAVRLLSHASSVERYVPTSGATRSNTSLILHLPVDYMDLLDDSSAEAIIEAAQRAGKSVQRVTERLAPETPGWRDRLAEIEDWGSSPTDARDWTLINERVEELKSLFSRALTVTSGDVVPGRVV